MPKITPKKRKSEDRETVIVKTQGNKILRPTQWWKAKDSQDRCTEVLGTASFLKEQQQYRYRQAALYARLYSNYPLFGWIGSNFTKGSLASQLPSDRPTLNVVQSCVDTLVSRITQSKPRPMFLTDGGDYKQRTLAKQYNNFIQGEFYQSQAYEKGGINLRDSAILGTGVTKICESLEHKATLERRLQTEILFDPNDAMFGNPRQLYEVALVDRYLWAEMFPGHKKDIMNAEQAFPDQGADSSKSIADQIMVVEAFRLPSNSKSNDGHHMICTTNGILLDEKWDKPKFPYIFNNYSDRLSGIWGQGLSEQLFGTQNEISKLLKTISESINLVGVPRVFVEEGSKVVGAHINNMIGAIVKYRGTKPQYEVAPCMPQEVYAQLQRLVEYAYQQAGISALAASSQKPAGLNSGEAIRNYDDLQSDRFATTSKKYERIYEQYAEQLFDKAQEIAERDGKYSTIYPNKNGTKVIDLPKIKKEQDPFIIQCFDISSLPKDPSGRLQKITEMIQAGMIDIREGRRLLDFPDLEQVEKLANASEERILQILDKICEDGEFTPPDSFMDLQLADKLAVQYYNLYVAAKLEDDKREMLEAFVDQVRLMLQEAQQPAPQAGLQVPGAQGQPVGMPQARPTSDIMPMLPGAA